ncbi:SDR family NAD(P)-dependent oxidoreductase [Idiomarina sp.]|uniref:SDR family NAD(P)-dependent oxidoreductase n=1 Tax=Idiomarina sp. TaxID=1874361 RepID=UPI003A954E15
MSIGVNIFSLKNKTALITGATGYLGREMAFGLAEAGAHVLVNSRSKKRCDVLVKELRDKGYSAEPVIFDVTSDQQVTLFADAFKNRALHVMINNAYVGGAGSVKCASTTDYRDSYDVAVVAAHRLLQTLLPNLRLGVKDSGEASIINIASMYALVSPDQRIYDSEQAVNPPFYGAAKAALLQWTKYSACEFGKEGIRVNSIAPGPFPAEIVQSKSPSFIKKLEHKVPMGRIGQAKELKGPLLFLASSASSYVNGSNLTVDGGWTCW